MDNLLEKDENSRKSKEGRCIVEENPESKKQVIN